MTHTSGGGDYLDIGELAARQEFATESLSTTSAVRAEVSAGRVRAALSQILARPRTMANAAYASASCAEGDLAEDATATAIER